MSYIIKLRWTARILSAVIVMFYGFFLIAHLIGDAGSASRPLNWTDYLILTTLVVSLVGLVFAWKWEFVGAATTLIAISICAAVNWRVLMFPGTLILLAAGLFLFCWLSARSKKVVPHATS